MSIYERGRRFYHEMTRVHDPVSPYEMSQKKLLQILGFSPQASISLLEAGRGEIFNLTDVDDIQALDDLDGVGPAQLARLAAFFALLHHYERWAAQPRPDHPRHTDSNRVL